MVVRKSNSYSRISRKSVTISPVMEDETYEGLLSAEERQQLLEEIEDEIHEEEVTQAKVKFKAAARTAIRVQKGLEEEQVTILIDAAGHTPYFRIDNKRYYHGYTYTVPYSLAETLMYMMDQGWRHEEAVGGANKDAYRKPRLTGLSPVKGITNAPTAQEVISPMSAGRVVPKVTTSNNLGERQI
jgi:hypothetical protein